MRKLMEPQGKLRGAGALRADGGLVEPAGPRPWPRWTRKLWWLLPLLVGALLLGLWGHEQWRAPASLDEVVLTGVPSPVPTNLVVVMDVSGSMTQYVQAREQALNDIVAWGQRHMRPDDTIAVFVFDDSAQQLLAPTPVGRLAAGVRLAPVTINGGGTDAGAALELLEKKLDGRPHTMVWITDTESLLPGGDQVAASMRKVSAVTTTTIIPHGAHLTDEWQDVFGFGAVEHADPGSASDTGVAIARAVARTTGQGVTKS